MVGVGIDNELVKSHQAADGDTSHDEYICLQEGEYVFTIYDSLDGICCKYGEGHYNKRFALRTDGEKSSSKDFFGHQP